MSHVLATAAEVVGLAALAVTGIGAAVGAAAFSAAVGVSAATISSVAALTAAGLGVLAQATAKKPTNVKDPMAWQSDPQAGLPIIAGRMYSAGKIFYRNTWGGTDLPYESLISAYSIGPIKQFETYYVDGVETTGFGTSAATPDEVNIPDLGYMFVDTHVGQQPEDTQCGSGPPNWDSSSKTSGLAVSNIRLTYDTKGNNTMTSEPRCGFVVNGVRVYDPRKDSTYPGGSGPQRWNDETTWSYDGYDNPHLFALAWLIGWRQNGKLVAGVGMPIAGILLDQFVEGANICDANGWKMGGQLDTTEDKWTRLKDILIAGAAQPLRLGAQIGCLTNTPRVSLATIGIADVIGDASVQATQAMRDRINAVVPRYMAEQSTTTANSDGTLRTTVTWGMTSAGPIIVDDYVTFDGKQRQKQIDFEFVQGVKTDNNAPAQVAQLARYAIEDAREFGPITLPLKLVWMGYRPGDVVTANLPELGLVNQDILLLQRKLSPADGSVTMTARSETSAKHAFALGQTTTAPATPTVSGPALVPTPGDTAWQILAETISANGTTSPALVVGGAADFNTIDAVIFEYRTYGTTPGDWQSAGTDGPATTGKAITGIEDGTKYQVAVSYRRGSAIGGRLILGPVTAGQTSVPWQTGVQGPGKPQDDATLGAPSGTPVGSSTADAVVSAIATARSEIAALQGGTTDYSSQISAVASDLAAEVSRAEGQEGTLSSQIVSLTSTVGGNTTAISSEAVARTSADTALGGRIDSLTTTVGGNSSSISSEVATRASADTALGGRIDSLTSTVGGNTSAISSEAATRASADGALSGQIYTLSATFSGAINSNPTFAAWADGANAFGWNAPIGWRTSGNDSPYAAAVPSGAELSPPASSYTRIIDGSWLVIEADLRPNGNGDSIAIGLQAFLDDRSTLAGGWGWTLSSTPTDNQGTIATFNGDIHRYRMLVDARVAGGREYRLFMDLGSDASCVVDKLLLRPASSAEIAGNRADANASSALAQISSNQAAQASVNSAQASTNSSLSASIGGNSSSIATQASAIASLQGRTGAFWQVTGVSGSGRAQLTLYADANGGGGVDIIGNVSISGNLVVSGSVTALQLAAGAATASYWAEQSASNGSPHGAQISISIAAEDIPLGQSTVGVRVSGSQNTNNTTYFDIGYLNGATDFGANTTTQEVYNPHTGDVVERTVGGWMTVGNLVNALPPQGGVFAYTTFLQLGPGSYTFAMYNHGDGNGGGPNIYNQSISVDVLKR